MKKGPGVLPRPFTKHLRTCKPDPVSILRWTSAIYLGSTSRWTSIDLPAGIGRTVLIPPEGGNPGLFDLSARGVYQAAPLTRNTGGPLPHLFILATVFRQFGGLPFCGTFHGTTVTSGTPSR